MLHDALMLSCLFALFAGIAALVLVLLGGDDFFAVTPTPGQRAFYAVLSVALIGLAVGLLSAA
jgi:predicted small integral membrane protein